MVEVPTIKEPRELSGIDISNIDSTSTLRSMVALKVDARIFLQRHIACLLWWITNKCHSISLVCSIVHKAEFSRDIEGATWSKNWCSSVFIKFIIYESYTVSGIVQGNYSWKGSKCTSIFVVFKCDIIKNDWVWLANVMEFEKNFLNSVLQQRDIQYPVY